MAFTHSHADTPTYTRTRRHTHSHACRHTHVYTHAHTSRQTRTHTHARTQTNTRTCTQIQNDTHGGGVPLPACVRLVRGRQCGLCRRERERIARVFQFFCFWIVMPSFPHFLICRLFVLTLFVFKALKYMLDRTLTKRVV